MIRRRPVLKLRESADGSWFVILEYRRPVLAGPFPTRREAIVSRDALRKELHHD